MPAEGYFEAVFDYYPRLQTPRPDVIFGLSAELLPKKYCGKHPLLYPESAPQETYPTLFPQW